MTGTRAGFFLPPGSFEEKFIRAGGHGGQNVNKVATVVQLRFSPGRAGLPGDAQTRLKTLAGSRLTAEGDILIIAGEHRTQEQNRRSARARLLGLIERALRRPKNRRRTMPSYGERQSRLEAKKRRSVLKRDRRAGYPPAD